MKKAVILLAEGFEEVEAVTQIDYLRRAGIEVTTAGIASAEITGSRGLKVMCDAGIEDIDAERFDAVVVPGGMPGAANVAESDAAGSLIKSLYKRSALVAAICAAPAVVLQPLGILSRKRATCYPGFENRFRDVLFSEEQVVTDGNIITSRGPGTAAEFAFSIISALVGEGKAAEIRKATLNG